MLCQTVPEILWFPGRYFGVDLIVAEGLVRQKWEKVIITDRGGFVGTS